MKLVLLSILLKMIISSNKRKRIDDLEEFTRNLENLFDFIKNEKEDFVEIFSLFDKAYSYKIKKFQESEYNTKDFISLFNPYFSNFNNSEVLDYSINEKEIEEIKENFICSSIYEKITAQEILKMSDRIKENVVALKALLFDHEILGLDEKILENSNFNQIFKKFLKISEYSCLSPFCSDFVTLRKNIFKKIDNIQLLPQNYTKVTDFLRPIFSSQNINDKVLFECFTIFLYHNLISWIEKVIYLFFEIKYLETKPCAISFDFANDNVDALQDEFLYYFNIVKNFDDKNSFKFYKKFFKCINYYQILINFRIIQSGTSLHSFTRNNKNYRDVFINLSNGFVTKIEEFQKKKYYDKLTRLLNESDIEPFLDWINNYDFKSRLKNKLNIFISKYYSTRESFEKENDKINERLRQLRKGEFSILEEILTEYYLTIHKFKKLFMYCKAELANDPIINGFYYFYKFISFIENRIMKITPVNLEFNKKIMDKFTNGSLLNDNQCFIIEMLEKEAYKQILTKPCSKNNYLFSSISFANLKEYKFFTSFDVMNYNCDVFLIGLIF